MERGHVAAVRDGDDRGSGKLVAQGGVDFPLGVFVEIGGGFVEEEPVWPQQQGARDGEALLFAAGEQLRPVGVFIETGR